MYSSSTLAHILTLTSYCANCSWRFPSLGRFNMNNHEFLPNRAFPTPQVRLTEEAPELLTDNILNASWAKFYVTWFIHSAPRVKARLSHYMARVKRPQTSPPRTAHTPEVGVATLPSVDLWSAGGVFGTAKRSPWTSQTTRGKETTRSLQLSQQGFVNTKLCSRAKTTWA